MFAWAGGRSAPLLSSGASPEPARRPGTAQYQMPGGLHDHPKTGVSRTRWKSLLVPLSWATYGVPLHLVLARRDQMARTAQTSPSRQARQTRPRRPICLLVSLLRLHLALEARSSSYHAHYLHHARRAVGWVAHQDLFARLVVPAAPADNVCVMRYPSSSAISCRLSWPCFSRCV